MDISKLSQEALVFTSNTPISKVGPAMISGRARHALVREGKSLKGIVHAEEIARRKVDNPTKTMISRFMHHVVVLEKEAGPEEIMQSFLVNDNKAIAVKDGGYRIMTKLTFLRSLVSEPSMKKVRVSDVMHYPYCVDMDDTIAVARSMLKDMKISRLPVLSGDGSPEGVLDALDLMKADIEKRRATRGERRGESIDLDAVPVSSILSGRYQKARGQDTLKKAAEAMLKSGNPTMLVEDGGKIAGIITPKIILSSLFQQVSVPAVSLSGMDDIDPHTMNVIEGDLNRFIEKHTKFLTIDDFKIHTETHRKGGDRAKFSVKATLSTPLGTFHSDDHAWDITKAFASALNKLEKEVRKKKGRYYIGRT